MSNAEARSWWADVQHLRPDAPAASGLVPAPAGRDGDFELDFEPAPARRFIRAERPRRPEGHDRAVLAEPSHVDLPAPRRIVLLQDEAAPAITDVDFDFGRAAEDRARRRTAERLGTATAPSHAVAPAGDDGTRTAVDARGAEGAVSPRQRQLGTSRASGTAGAPDPAALDSAARGAGGALGTRLSAAPDGAPAPLALVSSPPRAGLAPLSRRTAGSTPARRARREALASRPDRIALWAVVLGILLIALAAASSRAGAAAPGTAHQAAVQQSATPAPSHPLADVASAPVAAAHAAA